MTAHDQMRAMLDQLMGTGRNGENSQVKFSDSKVCKSFLLRCCPNEILASTRKDIGECQNIHDLALRADYEAASKHTGYNYIVEARQHLKAFIMECDKRVETSKQQLAETQKELSIEIARKANVVHELTVQIGEMLARAESLGTDGFIDESMMIMDELEILRAKKALANHEYQNTMPSTSHHRQMLRVCEVCSAYLGIHDSDRRLADHFGGKLHLGFMTIRQKLTELDKMVEEKRPQHSESGETEPESDSDSDSNRNKERRSRVGRRGWMDERRRRRSERDKCGRSRDRGHYRDRSEDREYHRRYRSRKFV